MAAVLFAGYATLAIRLHQRMLTSGFDLGIFDETVRAYAHGHLPMVALKGVGFDELGDHFSPIWALLAPIYRVFPTVYTLLIAQAALLAVAVAPLMSWAERELGRGTAVAVGIGYGLSWGIASAAGFDVHEVAFAVPLLAYSVTALGHRRWCVAVGWGLPLLLVKEDLGLTLAGIGVYVAVCGARRLGLAAMVVGVLGTALEIGVLIPAFNSGHTYTYSGSVADVFRGGMLGLLGVVVRFVVPDAKIVTVVLLLAVTGFLALRSPITLLVVPTLTWRFLADNPAYWGSGYQYSAVLMPIVFAGFIDALVRWRDSGHPQSVAVRRAAVIVSLTVTAVLLPLHPLRTLAEPSMWRADPRIAVAHRMIGEIPGGVTVAAGNQLDPQLTDRDTVFLLDSQTPERHPAWVLIDTENPDDIPFSGGQQAQVIGELRQEGYRTLANEAGYLLLRR